MQILGLWVNYEENNNIKKNGNGKGTIKYSIFAQALLSSEEYY